MIHCHSEYPAFVKNSRQEHNSVHKKQVFILKLGKIHELLLMLYKNKYPKNKDIFTVFDFVIMLLSQTFIEYESQYESNILDYSLYSELLIDLILKKNVDTHITYKKNFLYS